MIEVVLVVEDEIILLEALAELLQTSGFTVLPAQTVAQALAFVEQAPRIDLLLVDIMLLGRPGGVALARTIRSVRPGIPVIFTTGDVQERDLIGASERHASILPKPFDAVQLLRAIASAAPARRAVGRDPRSPAPT